MKKNLYKSILLTGRT